MAHDPCHLDRGRSRWGCDPTWCDHRHQAHDATVPALCASESALAWFLDEVADPPSWDGEESF